MHRASAFAIAVLALAACSGSGGRIEIAADGLNTPFGVAFDADDNMYVVEYKGNQVLKAAPGGKLKPFAGTGEAGFGGDGGPAADARLNGPHCLTMLPGKLFIADTGNHRIRVVNLESGVIDTLVGTGERGMSAEGTAGKAAILNGPFAVDAKDGKLYVADLFNLRVRMIDAAGAVVRTIAGNGEKGAPEDGAAAKDSPLADPRAAAIDRRGYVYILERQGNALRVVDPQGKIRTVIGPDHAEVKLNSPKHMAVDLDGDVIIADDENHRILKYNPDGGKWAVLAGTSSEGDAFVPDRPLETELRRPHGVTVHRSGDIFIADSNNGRVLRLRR